MRLPSRSSPACVIPSALLAVFAALTIAYTWPLAAHLGDAFLYPVPGPSPLAHADLRLTSWILAWGAHQLRHDPLRLFDANFFYPLPQPLAFSENLLAGVLLVLPLDIAFGNAVLDHNAVVLASFALGGAGTALLVRDLGGSSTAAIAVGAMFAFGPLRQAQLGHVHALSTHWMPFALLATQRLLRCPRAASALGFGVTLVLVALSSVYYLYYFGIAVTLFVVLHAVWRCPAAPGAYRWAIGLGLVVAVVLVPTLLPYAATRARFALAHDTTQAIGFSAVGAQYLSAFIAPASTLHRVFWNGIISSPLLGLGATTLFVLGLWRGMPRRTIGAYASLSFCMALLSLGPAMRLSAESPTSVPGPYALLAWLIPGFDALRVPQRAAATALLAAAVVMALGADVLVGPGRPRWRRALGALVLAGIVTVESWRVPVMLVAEPAGAAVPATYAWLAAQPGDFPIVEIPFGGALRESGYQLRSTSHWKRLVNGYTGTFPARNYLDAVFARFPNASSMRLLDTLGVRYAIVHQRPGSTRAGCLALGRAATPTLVLRLAEGADCIFAVDRALPPPPAPSDCRLSLADARLSTSSGDDPRLAVDGDVRTHWVQPIVAEEGWLRIDLPVPREVTRIVLRLGPHFGEYLRAYEVVTSVDGATWTVAARQEVAEPPLVGLVTRPEDLATEIRLSGEQVRSLRLVRPSSPVGVHGLYLDWGWWGVHEIELYERITPP